MKTTPKTPPDAEGYISIRTEFINKNYKAVIEYDADDEFSDEICALKAKACLMVAMEYSGLTVPRIFKRR